MDDWSEMRESYFQFIRARGRRIRQYHASTAVSSPGGASATSNTPPRVQVETVRPYYTSITPEEILPCGGMEAYARALSLPRDTYPRPAPFKFGNRPPLENLPCAHVKPCINSDPSS